MVTDLSPPVSVHVGENLAGDKGWYWCQKTTTAYGDSGDKIYLSGRSGVGPFPTEQMATDDARKSLSDDHHPAFGLM